jgi:hypothetical protein
MSKNKKSFSETGLGKILTGVLPQVIKGASKVLPDNGVLGIIKNIIDTDPDMSTEEKEAAHDQLLELYRLEVEDRDSARSREARIKEAGGNDWMMSLTGIVGLSAFAFLVYTVVTTNVPESNKEIFIHMIGIVEGVALSIFGYYFGSAVKKENKNG